MKLIRALVVVSFFVIGAISAWAQPATVQQLQLSQQTMQQQIALPGLMAGTNAPELYQGENLDVGPQRILRLNPRPTYFDVLLDSEVFYSDNPAFAQTPNRLQSFVYVNTIQVAFTPPPITLGPGKFAPNIGFSSQWYNYDNIVMSALDFQARTAFVGGKYAVGNWLATVGANYTELLDQGTYTETYHEFLPTLSVLRFITLNDSMLLAIGDQVDYHATWVPTFTNTNVTNQRSDLNDHFDNIVFLTFNWQMTEHFAVQPFYRFQYSYYPRNAENTSDRNDYLNALGITAIYTFNQYFSARAFCNFNTKLSDDPGTPEYTELNGGVGASLEIKF